MEINIDNHEKIYQKVKTEICNLINLNNIQTTDLSISAAQTETTKILNELISKMDTEIDSLKANSEWNTFTIAFYGETNAGKSTIIETLRLYFSEKTKQEAQEKFNELSKEYNVTEDNYNNIKQNIAKYEVQAKEIEDKLTELVDGLGSIVESHKQEYFTVQQQAEQEAAERNWWQSFIHIFKKTPIDEQLIEQKERYEKSNREYKRQLADLQKNKQQVVDVLNSATNNLKEFTEKKELIEAYSDGSIIGTGMSDFTKHNSYYEFYINGESVKIVDVPGIEGNEKQVIDSILEAVHKAHVVFYVTRKAGAPQSGGNQLGTLEKIKNHLGAQTEVWTIFNQSVKNPIRLQKPLINEDDKNSLAEMNAILSQNLGSDTYQGEFILSAYPAFLSEASCLIPGCPTKISQEKFLSKYSHDELLNLSGFTAFVDAWPEKIINNWKNKIIASNYKKVSSTIQDAIHILEMLNRDTFSPLIPKMKTTVKDAKALIDNRSDDLQQDLKKSKYDLIQVYKRKSRDIIYAKIDENISNSDFKRFTEATLNEQKSILQKELEKESVKHSNTFKSSIDSIIKKCTENIKEILDTMEFSPGLKDFKLDIEIDRGIDWWALIFGIASLIAGWGTGWAEILGILSCCWTVYTAVRSYFSDDFKKKQQRKAADENIRETAKNIDKAIDQAIESSIPNLEKELNKVKCQLDELAKIPERISNNLSNSVIILHKISKNIRGKSL